MDDPVIVAALYVESGGIYFGREDVDPWDLERDARTYAGPHPVVAHPPCKRWGRYWSGGPSAKTRRTLGDDEGCFEFALAATRRFGGVLEHPEASHAWLQFGLNPPPHTGPWITADFQGGWTCCVEQGHYGHRARKKTWLYAHGVKLPSLVWGPSRSTRETPVELLTTLERRVTPAPFAELLIAMAKTAAVIPPDKEDK